MFEIIQSWRTHSDKHEESFFLDMTPCCLVKVQRLCTQTCRVNHRIINQIWIGNMQCQSAARPTWFDILSSSCLFRYERHRPSLYRSSSQVAVIVRILSTWKSVAHFVLCAIQRVRILRSIWNKHKTGINYIYLFTVFISDRSKS